MLLSISDLELATKHLLNDEFIVVAEYVEGVRNKSIKYNAFTKKYKVSTDVSGTLLESTNLSAIVKMYNSI